LAGVSGHFCFSCAHQRLLNYQKNWIGLRSPLKVVEKG